MCLVKTLFVLLVCLSAVIADCGVVTRKQWDGIDPVHVDYVSRPVDLVIIQHTGTPSCDNDAQCEAMVRNIQSYNMDIQKYWDLSANFLIGGQGKVYEGPGWLHVGAHTYGYNKKSIGISFIGNFNEDEPQEVALQAAKDLIKCGVENGHLQSNYSLVGHRQLIAIESPGRKIYNKIRQWPDWVEDASKMSKN